MLELIFILFALIIFVLPYTRDKIMKNPLIGIVLSTSLLALLIYSSSRWQMISMFILYILSLVVFIFMNYNENYKKFTISSKLFRQIGVIFISITVIINILFPLNNFIAFKGNYFVGTSTISITDYNRRSQNIKMGEFRNISVRIFYPSYKRGSEKHKLIDNPKAFDETMKRTYGSTLSKLFSYISLLETNSYYDVEAVDDKKMPLIIISHEWMEYSEYYYDIAEKMAADGYYVAVLNHTGNSPYTTLKNSNIEFGNNKLLQAGYDNSIYGKNVEKVFFEIKEDFNQVIEGIIKLSETDKKRFGQIDFKNIGLMGTSIGARAALDNSDYINVKAVIAYDPYVESNPSYFLKNKIEIPSLILISQEWLKSVNTRYLIQVLESGDVDNKNVYSIDKFTHKDFTLLSLLTPIYRLNGTTKSTYKRALDIKYKTSKAYFDYYLKKLNTKNNMIELIEETNGINKIMLR